MGEPLQQNRLIRRNRTKIFWWIRKFPPNWITKSKPKIIESLPTHVVTSVRLGHSSGIFIGLGWGRMAMIYSDITVISHCDWKQFIRLGDLLEFHLIRTWWSYYSHRTSHQPNWFIRTVYRKEWAYNLRLMIQFEKANAMVGLARDMGYWFIINTNFDGGNKTFKIFGSTVINRST